MCAIHEIGSVCVCVMCKIRRESVCTWLIAASLLYSLHQYIILATQIYYTRYTKAALCICMIGREIMCVRGLSLPLCEILYICMYIERERERERERASERARERESERARAHARKRARERGSERDERTSLADNRRALGMSQFTALASIREAGEVVDEQLFSLV